jgi:hypothetical protein
MLRRGVAMRAQSINFERPIEKKKCWMVGLLKRLPPSVPLLLAIGEHVDQGPEREGRIPTQTPTQVQMEDEVNLSLSLGKKVIITCKKA